VCKICLSKPVNRVLIPCGHVICKECRPNIVACHICRQKILQDNSLYI
jgi:hypothetical protein